MKKAITIIVLLLLAVDCSSIDHSRRTVTVCKSNVSFLNFGSFTHTMIAQDDEVLSMDVVGILKYDSIAERDLAFTKYQENESEFNENIGISISNEIYEDTSIIQTYTYDLELAQREEIIINSISLNRSKDGKKYVSRDMMVKQRESTNFTCYTE